jgi:hypothetical protein
LRGWSTQRAGGGAGSSTNIWQRNARAKRKAVADQGGEDLSSTRGEGKLPGQRSTLEVKEFFMSAASVIASVAATASGLGRRIFGFAVVHVRPGAAWYEVHECLLMEASQSIVTSSVG